MAYRPQTDGQTERANREVENYLKVWTNNRKDNWVEWLSVAEFSINIKPAAATGVSPFELNHGRIPNFGVSPRRVSSNKSVEDFFKRMEAATKEAKAALEHTNDLMVEQENRHRRPARNFVVVQKVWLEATHLNLPKAAEGTKKLSDRRIGPFKIVKKIGASAYKLKLLTPTGSTPCLTSHSSPHTFPHPQHIRRNHHLPHQ